MSLVYQILFFLPQLYYHVSLFLATKKGIISYTFKTNSRQVSYTRLLFFFFAASFNWCKRFFASYVIIIFIWHFSVNTKFRPYAFFTFIITFSCPVKRFCSNNMHAGVTYIDAVNILCSGCYEFMNSFFSISFNYQSCFLNKNRVDGSENTFFLVLHYCVFTFT